MPVGNRKAHAAGHAEIGSVHPQAQPGNRGGKGTEQEAKMKDSIVPLFRQRIAEQKKKKAADEKQTGGSVQQNVMGQAAGDDPREKVAEGEAELIGEQCQKRAVETIPAALTIDIPEEEKGKEWRGEQDYYAG
jgi:hypothetical protein